MLEPCEFVTKLNYSSLHEKKKKNCFHYYLHIGVYIIDILYPSYLTFHLVLFLWTTLIGRAFNLLGHSVELKITP